MNKPKHPRSLRSPKLSRDLICASALELARRGGLESISMRKVAGVLSVEAMSLYRHVENKDALLDGMIELIIREMTLPSANLPWKEALAERARSERKVLSEHAWIIHLLETKSGTGQVRLEHQNHMIGILRRSGFSVEQTLSAMIVLTGYVYGFALFASAWNPNSKERKKVIQRARAEIQPASFPYVIEVVQVAQANAASPGHIGVDHFEFGLKILLDGIEKQRKSG